MVLKRWCHVHSCSPTVWALLDGCTAVCSPLSLDYVPLPCERHICQIRARLGKHQLIDLTNLLHSFLTYRTLHTVTLTLSHCHTFTPHTLTLSHVTRHTVTHHTITHRTSPHTSPHASHPHTATHHTVPPPHILDPGPRRTVCVAWQQSTRRNWTPAAARRRGSGSWRSSCRW